MNAETLIECPCCTCKMLSGRGAFDICPVCNWEDDGQDEGDADVVRGGPNGDLSLTRARQNFRDYGTSVPDFGSPDELYEFVQLIARRIQETGLPTSGEHLQKVNSPAYTTGSEWLGEIGSAIRGEHLDAAVDLPSDVQRGIRRILRTVRRTWPDL